MFTLINDNERSHAIDLISIINNITSQYDLYIKRAGGERTILAQINQEGSTSNLSKREMMFPDVVLYGDTAKTQILQGWELKLPDTPITDETFIKDAHRKALALDLNSCFIWNFRAGVLYVKNDMNLFEIKKQWNNAAHIRTREDVSTYSAVWEDEIKNILLEMNEYFISGVISGTTLGEIISNTVVATLISRHKKSVQTCLETYTISDRAANAYLEQWWKEVKNEYTNDESNKYSAYAKIVIINWINRITFAHLIKKYHNTARQVTTLNQDISPAEANILFDDITSSCDFYSIFAGIKFNIHIPPIAWSDIIEFNTFLNDNGIDEIDQSSLQNILEKTVSTIKREFAGQFTTPIALAELLAKITIINAHGNVIDPCCGTGTIPKQVLLYKNTLLPVQDAVDTTWASDKYEFPLQVANISLTSPASINIPNRVFKHNALNVYQTESINLVDPKNGNVMKVDLPKFDAILSNLPFIPFETIQADDSALFNDLIDEVNRETGCSLTNKSDLYCFIIFAMHKLLSQNGRAGFITSNSWLGTVWGKVFYRALNYYFKVEQIHISGNGRWFNNANVVTVIIILTQKTTIALPTNLDVTHFYLWKKSLSEIEIDVTIKDSIIHSALLSQNLDESILKQSSYQFEHIQNILNLNVSLNAFFHHIEWLKEISSHLVPITTVFSVSRGERRGWDAMFYPESGHGIEDIYIKKVLKNARTVHNLTASPDNDAFCCSDSLETLRNNNMYGAIAWIDKFQNDVNNLGTPLPEVLAKPNLEWYEMQDTSTAEIVTMMNPDKRLFFAKFSSPTFINQRLIGFRQNTDYTDIELSHALLNSIIGMFYIEAVGFGRGLGVLDINKASISKSFMLNPNNVSQKDRDNIIAKFASLINREIMSTEEELDATDRIEFDNAVLSAFGIKSYYGKIKHSLLSMQQARRSVNSFG